MYEENESALKGNGALLHDLLGQLYKIEANGKISHNCQYPLPLIQAAQS